MSDSDDSGREWRLFVVDMISFGERILAYTDGLTQAEFAADDKTYDAVLRTWSCLAKRRRTFRRVCEKRTETFRGAPSSACAIA